MSLKQTTSPIYKFITYVVSNLYPLLEYAENVILKYIEQFKEEADDLGIQITDVQLRKYIERFDQIKNSPKITDRELKNYTLSQLIKLITSSEGVNSGDEIDDTPDVVYHEGNKIIYNGAKEGNCIIYGRGERWCITKGSYASYRYSSYRYYPTFYLAKNGDLPNSDRLSFVAIQVRDTSQESNRYVYTSRDNRPNESQPMSFEELMREIPWLANIPNIKRILKYIPLTQSEKNNRTYGSNPISVREWMNLEFPVKKQYLVIRGNSGGETFSDISDNEFISKYLPKFPQLATFVAITPGVFDGIDLLRNIEEFSTQVQGSIIANFRDLVNLDYLKTDKLDFNLKKFLVERKKWKLDSNQRIYITEDGSTIVLLEFDSNDIKLGLYQENDDYPNAKITKRTSKYLLEYPELDKIPFQNLLDLASKNIINSDIITSVLEKAESDPNSAITSKNINGKQIIIDSNSFSSFKIEDGKISRIPFMDEDVQTVFAQEENNKGFQESALNLIKTNDDIPSSIDKEAFLSIVNSIPYPQRIYLQDNTPSVILTAQGNNEGSNIFSIDTTGNVSFLKSNNAYGNGENWRMHRQANYSRIDSLEQVQSIVNFLRETNRPLNNTELLNTLNGEGYTSPSVDIIKQFVQANPPLNPENTYRPVVFNDTLLIINTANPRESKQLSDRSGKLVKANISPTQAARLLGTTPAAAQGAGERVAAPLAGAPRRGRPAGVPNAPAAPAPAPAGGGASVPEIMANYELGNGFTQIPGRSFTRLNTNTGVAVNINNNRGASRRNNLLGNNGRVVRNIAVGPSDIYIIRLANGTYIASVVVQPGNSHYLITPTNAISLNSPAELLNALQQRNLAEARGYIMNEYLERNPHHKNEFKELIKKTITEKQTNK
jgi:hypothetical protein